MVVEVVLEVVEVVLEEEGVQTHQELVEVVEERRKKGAHIHHTNNIWGIRVMDSLKDL